MSAAAEERSGAQASGPETNEPTAQTSKVLPELWQRLKPAGRLTVLELGRALPETVAFFAAQRCRIHFVDLFGELESGALGDANNPSTLERQFQDLFGLPFGTRLDLCLLWDLTHYLDERRLRAFSRALWPWLTPQSLAHAFAVRSAGTDLLNREYGILNRDTLSVRRRATGPRPCKPHPPAFMNEWLTCFSTGRGVLLPDGRVETLMLARL